jgi:hypothetical protein
VEGRESASFNVLSRNKCVFVVQPEELFDSDKVLEQDDTTTTDHAEVAGGNERKEENAPGYDLQLVGRKADLIANDSAGDNQEKRADANGYSLGLL